MTLEDCYRWGKADVLKMHQQTQRSYRAVYQRTSTCSWWCAVICLFKDFFLPKDTRQKRQPSTNRVCPAAPQDREPKSQGPLMANLLSTSLCASPSPLQGDGLHSKTQRGNKKKNLGQGGCLLAAALPKFRIAAACTAAHNRGCGGWPGAPFMRTSHTSCVYLSSEPGFIARNLVLEHVHKLCLALARSHGWPWETLSPVGCHDGSLERFKAIGSRGKAQSLSINLAEKHS